MGIQNPRQVYGETLVDLGRENRNIVVLDADLSKSTMSCLFQDAFPDRYFEMGIAEANMTSFAAGLSLTGKIPFINSFAVFASGRAYDQIRVGICVPRLNVRIVGSSAGLSDFGDGATHQSVEDVALMRALPHMTVLVPADANETRNMTKAIVDFKGPVYLRINRNDMPDVISPSHDFEIGKAYLLRDGTDAVIFAMGFMVSKALQASEILEREGLSVRVVNVSTLKPLKDEEIRKYAEGMTGIVTAEEHSLIGGLANAVTYGLRGWGIPIETVGIADRFGQSARSYDELLEEYGLTEHHIARAVRQALRQTEEAAG
jgi:transketolase